MAFFSVIPTYVCSRGTGRKLQKGKSDTRGSRWSKTKLVPRYCCHVKAAPVIKVEQSLGRVHTQAGSHILVVGQGGAEAQQTHVLLRQLHITDGPRHQRFQHGPTVIVQQVDFILQNEFTALETTFLVS